MEKVKKEKKMKLRSEESPSSLVPQSSYRCGLPIMKAAHIRERFIKNKGEKKLKDFSFRKEGERQKC